MTAGYDDREAGFGERDREAGSGGYPARNLDVEDPALGGAARGPHEQMPASHDADHGTDHRTDRGTDHRTDRGTDHDADLVPADSRANFESRWRETQAMFVDEPREAVRRANTLLDEVVRSVMAGFAERTAALEQRPNANANTEQLRQALRSYRALFDRVLRI